MSGRRSTLPINDFVIPIAPREGRHARHKQRLPSRCLQWACVAEASNGLAMDGRISLAPTSFISPALARISVSRSVHGQDGGVLAIEAESI